MSIVKFVYTMGRKQYDSCYDMVRTIYAVWDGKIDQGVVIIKERKYRFNSQDTLFTILCDMVKAGRDYVNICFVDNTTNKWHSLQCFREQIETNLTEDDKIQIKRESLVYECPYYHKLLADLTSIPVANRTRAKVRL